MLTGTVLIFSESAWFLIEVFMNVFWIEQCWTYQLFLFMCRVPYLAIAKTFERIEEESKRSLIITCYNLSRVVLGCHFHILVLDTMQ